MFLNDLKSLSSLVVRGRGGGCLSFLGTFGELKSVSTELRSTLAFAGKMW